MRFRGMYLFTLGESLRRGTLVFYFTVATLFLLFFGFAIGHIPGDPASVTFFGNPISQNIQQSFNVVDFLLLQLHSASVFWIILLGIFGIAGMIPRMLDKGTIDLFLSKPLWRGELFMARSLGAVSGVAANLFYFYFGIWCIFGLKTGVWHTGFLYSMFLVIYAFFCFYSFVALVGLITRSSGISVLLSFIFALLSIALGSRGSGFLFVISDNIFYQRILDAVYFATPQLHNMLDNSSRLISGGLLPNPQEFTFTPYIYSLFSTSFLYLLAVWYFSRRDY